MFSSVSMEITSRENWVTWCECVRVETGRGVDGRGGDTRLWHRWSGRECVWTSEARRWLGAMTGDQVCG